MDTILITGAGRGIGLEMARQYALDGWRVMAACRRPEAADSLGRLSREAGGRVSVHRLEVTDGGQIAALARELAGRPIDLLVNNAGVYGSRDDSFGKVDDATWIEVLRVNTIAPLRMAEAFVEHVAGSRRKVIATVSSRMGSLDDNRSGGFYAYRTAKAAANMVTKNLSVDLRDRGIACVVLHPGWVRTDMGGPGAPLGVEESVRGLKLVLDRVGPEDSGKFLGHDGAEVPW